MRTKKSNFLALIWLTPVIGFVYLTLCCYLLTPWFISEFDNNKKLNTIFIVGLLSQLVGIILSIILSIIILK